MWSSKCLSELFYSFNFFISIIISLIGLVFNLLIITIIINYRKCHTVNYFLIGDLCMSSIVYFILHITGCYYGIRDDWHSHQPLCVFRAYCIVVSISAMTYSFSIQAISRLFFSVFYTHSSLLNWRAHQILILVKWLMSFALGIRLVCVDNSFELIEEHRMCGIRTNKLSVAPYSIGFVYVLPKSIAIVIYAIVFHQVRLSSMRVKSRNVTNITTACITLTFVKKNLIIIRNMLIILNILICGGAPYLILMLWDFIPNGNPPKELYFISVNSLVSATAMMAIVTFFKDKRLRNRPCAWFLQSNSSASS